MLRASATSIKLTPVYNSSTNTNTDGSSADLPYSYFLEVDGIRVLLDCGWNDNFETEYLAALYPYLSQVDAVLLSSADMKACGALPFVVEHLRPGAVIAAVGSTSKLGLHSLLNCFLSHYPNTHDFGVFTGESSSLATFQLSIDKIYSAFRSVSEPYGGTVSVVKDERSMSCHATFAGRMLGGHVWELKYQIDSILYCPDFSAIPSYALKRFKVPTTPNIVLLEGYPIHIVRNKISSSKYEEQLEALFKDIQRTMRGGGDVLIPVSAAGRGLEMLIILLHLLMEKGGERYKVVFASLQSQELLDKASTMTEAFQDSIILSDRQLFANVIACKNTQEVLQIPSPKVCIADGESLDYGISADLLEHFLPHKSSDNSENMIVLPDVPKAGTTASAIAESVQHQPFSYSYLQRTLLSKEELEEYYLQQEHDAELKRTQLNDHEGFKVVDDEEEQSAADDDDDADEVGEAADSAENRNLVESQTKAQKPNTPGLVLPAYIHFNSKHLNFPSLANDNTLCAARSKGIDTAYGLPLSEAEYQVMHKRAPIRSDQGPDGPLIFNDAQREANTPAKVMEVTKQVMRNCRLVISDLSGSPDAHTLKSLINSKLSFAKKLVSIRSSPEDHRLLALFCRGEKHLKCSEQVHMATAKGVAVELATQVFSYVVQLNHELAHALPASLRRVRENHSKEAWEVGWTNGELRRLGGREEVKDQDDGQPDAQRLRLEEEARLALVPLADSKRQQCAEQIEESGIQRGSFFVGSMDLHRLRDTTRRDAGLYSEFHKTAPMLVYDSGACVRRGENGTVTIACVASPSMFDVRRSVYAQFAQTL